MGALTCLAWCAPLVCCAAATAPVKELSLSAEDWRCVRQESFPDSGINEFKHYRLPDFSDNVNALPR